MEKTQLAFSAKFPGINGLSKIRKFEGKSTLEHRTARSLCVELAKTEQMAKEDYWQL